MFVNAKRIIIKIGSSLIVDEAGGAGRAAWLSSLAEDSAALKHQGKQVLVVTSGGLQGQSRGQSRVRAKY